MITRVVELWINKLQTLHNTHPQGLGGEGKRDFTFYFICIFFKNKFIYLFIFGCVVVHGLLIAVASLIEEHGL